MARRTFNVACLVSPILLVITLAMCVAGFVLNPWDHRVSLSDEFHVGVMSPRWGDFLLGREELSMKEACISN